MTRSSSAEPAPRQSKRKGTRSVSSLTPAQLARKRANDREAQRAIRARTKEHIERLERELAELKSGQSRDRTVHELLRRNKALEQELSRLQEHVGISVASSPYSTPAVYDDSLSSGSGTISSPRMSPLPSVEYSRFSDYAQPYGTSISNACESWASPVANHMGLSTVSSPSPPVPCDDYSTTSNYHLPTSVPPSIISARPRAGPLDAKGMKMEYEDLDSHDAGFRLDTSAMGTVSPAYVHQQSPTSHQHPSGSHQVLPQPSFSQPDVQSPHARADHWNMYPMFYQGPLDQRAQGNACVSR